MERRAGRVKEGREVELGNSRGWYSWKKKYPFAFGSGSIGRYPSSGGSAYMFNADALM